MPENTCDTSCTAQPLRDHTGTGIARRAFLSQSAVMAAMAALAACSLDAGGTAPSSVSLTVKLSDHASLASVGGVAVLTASGSPIAVVRTGASSFTALSLVCPHQGATIGQSGSGFQCPRHGATFTLSGAWVGGEPTSSMRSYPAVYDATAGTVVIG